VNEIIGIHHTGLHVRDIEASVRFYTELLGLQLVARREAKGGYVTEIVGYPGAEMRFAFVQHPDGGPLIELIQYVNPGGQPIDTATCNPGTAHVCFQVSDIFPIYERLKAAGVSFKSDGPVAITEWVNQGGYAIYLTDPDGITLELLQRPTPPA
jgi:catechol 2,3-dioxygenase-like lactoylglutathione lyase family enzyme